MGQDRKDRKGNNGRLIISFDEELAEDDAIEKAIGYRQMIILFVITVLIIIREIFFPTDIIVTELIMNAFQ
jgi:hypothetical protein